ncbi:MAG TPA: phosphotransferase [Chloroflexia bacterium]|nr:phosphotransferase [Chloroflexia bacterium]
MVEVVTDVKRVTPAWLTSILCREGVLPQGEVEAVQVRSVEGNSSILSYLTLSYSAYSPPSAPGRLFLKMPRQIDWALEACALEIEFFHVLWAGPPPPSCIIRCYDAAHDPESGLSHLLLDDLSETHLTTITLPQILAGDTMPSQSQLEQMVDCIAQFHAYWWEHPSLGAGIASSSFPGEEDYRAWVQRRETEFAGFVCDVGSRFPAGQIELYERALQGLPTLWERYLGPRLETLERLTLIHGDCYFIQFLCAKEGDGPAILVDFQSTSAFLPAQDLAWMFATFWTPEQRRENNREESLLRRYLARLHEHGVANYSWEELMLDYKLSVTLLLFSTIWDQHNGTTDAYWVPKLSCVTGAYVDLGCADFV